MLIEQQIFLYGQIQTSPSQSWYSLFYGIPSWNNHTYDPCYIIDEPWLYAFVFEDCIV